jgi:hypothetical protein
MTERAHRWFPEVIAELLCTETWYERFLNLAARMYQSHTLLAC